MKIVEGVEGMEGVEGSLSRSNPKKEGTTADRQTKFFAGPCVDSPGDKAVRARLLFFVAKFSP
jgi:hypothetical protein